MSNDMPVDVQEVRLSREEILAREQKLVSMKVRTVKRRVVDGLALAQIAV